MHDLRDFSRLFEFGVGLRGFDGKVAQGARLPDPPERRTLRWVCEACGKRHLPHFGPGASKCAQEGPARSRVHVCANCNSGWHGECIARLYAQRRESGKANRKVPIKKLPHWVCPQCTFYAEERERRKQQHLSREQWRQKLNQSKLTIPIKRNQPAGGTFGTADAFVHDVNKAFAGLGVEEAGASSTAASSRRLGLKTAVCAQQPGEDAQKDAEALSSGGGISGGAASADVAGARDAASAADVFGEARKSLREEIGERLLRFVEWPPRTMMEILVYVRQDLGMPSVSLADLSQVSSNVRMI